MDRSGRRLKRIFRRGRQEEPSSANVRRSVAILALVAVVSSLSLGAKAVLRADRQASEDWGALSAARRAGLAADARRQTQAAPIDATPWLQLAWLESKSPQGVGPSGNAALLRSYALAPYGPEATLWRQAFIFDNWRAVTPEVRARALDEMTVVYSRQGWDIQSLAKTVKDPTGRMVAIMASQRLRAVETVRHAERQKP